MSLWIERALILVLSELHLILVFFFLNLYLQLILSDDEMEVFEAVAKRWDGLWNAKTIRLWHIEFMKNAYRWKESLRGKYTRCTVFDGNKLLRRATRKYLETVVTRKSTKANPNPAFRMQDF